MNNYMDKSFVIANNTIISYSGQHTTLKIPERFFNIGVSGIGDGAFMESSKLQSVVLPPKVSAIGEKAFYGCSELTSVSIPGGIVTVGKNAFANCVKMGEITVYDLPMSVDEYHSFKFSANRSSEGVYVLREMPKLEAIQKIISAIPFAVKAQQIPADIESLFQISELEKTLEKLSLNTAKTIIGFKVPSKPVSENSAFCLRIQKPYCEVCDSKAEEQNDWYVRVGKARPIVKTIIFTFDDRKTKEDNGKILMEATLKIGYFFWQSSQPIVYNQKKYYIYRRCYLGVDSEMPYIRRDIAMYTDDGLVYDREEAQTVYAKYKLLSIL